jgi:glutathione S-transferase
MITVHHLNNSRSQRILWLLEELGLPYEIRRYQRDARTMLAPPELLQVHPLGKSPVITDGDITVAESGAIVEYLLDTYGEACGLRPARGGADWRRYTYWLHFAEGSAMPPLVMKLVMQKVKTAPMPFFARPIARGVADKVLSSFVDPNLDRQTAFMEAELANTPWFIGTTLSAADIQMSFPVEAAKQRAGLSPDRTPRLLDWLARAHARPAYQRALERGGKYDFA